MVNLFFSGIACGSGHVHRKALGIDNETLTPLNLQLYVGDISSPYNICLRRDVYNAYFEMDSDVSSNLRRLKKLLKNDKQLCLWYSSLDVDEYLGMLATIAHFDGKGILFYLADCCEMCESIPDLQMVKVKIKKIERRALSNEDKTKLLAEWARIQAENAPLRILKDGKVIGLPADYIDERLFSFMGEKEVQITDLCQEFLRGELSCRLTYLLWRLRQLIEKGTIVVVKEGWDTEGFYGAPMKNFVRCIIKKNQ